MKMFAVAALFTKSPTEIILVAMPWIAEHEHEATAGVVDKFRRDEPAKTEFHLAAITCNAASDEQLRALKHDSKPATLLQLVPQQSEGDFSLEALRAGMTDSATTERADTPPPSAAVPPDGAA